MIEIILQGKPRALKRHRPSARGGYYDPSSKDKKDVLLRIAAYRPKKPFIGNIKLILTFIMPIPKSWYGTGKNKYIIKNKHKGKYWHTNTPDLDNLVKMIADILQGKDRFILDDSQISVIEAQKIYGNIPRTSIKIQEINSLKQLLQ